VRLIPRRLAEASTRESTCVSKRRLIVPVPISSSCGVGVAGTGTDGATLPVGLGAARSLISAV
jgi:hypothetical protein